MLDPGCPTAPMFMHGCGAMRFFKTRHHNPDTAYAQGVHNALEKSSADSGNLAEVMTLSFEEPDARPAQPNTAS